MSGFIFLKFFINYFSSAFRSDVWLAKFEKDLSSEDDEANVGPRIGTDYLGRPVVGRGLEGGPTLLFQDLFGWTLPVNIGTPTVAFLIDTFAEHRIFHLGGHTTSYAGTHYRGGNDDIGIITPAFERLLRFNLIVRNLFVLSIHPPTTEHFDLVSPF